MHRLRREGLEMSSPCGLSQDLFIQCEIRDSLPQPLVLQLKMFQLLELVSAHAAIVLAPAVLRELGHANLTNGINSRHSLAP